MNEIEEILLHDEHVFRIEYEQWQIPEIDYETLFPENADIARRKLKFLGVYLNSHSIYDDFEDHSARKMWKMNLQVEYGDQMYDFIAKNSFRAGNINGIASDLDYILSKSLNNISRQIYLELSSLYDYVNALRKSYDDLTNQQRYDEVKKLKVRIYDTLKFMATMI